MIGAVIASFQKGANTLKGPQWVGLENYAYLLGNPSFWDVLAVTGRFLVIIIPLQVVTALFLAIILNERVPGIALVRTAVFIPVAAPAAVASVIWGIAYQPRGPINAVLESIGLPPQPFLTDSDQALQAIIVLMSWIGVGYWTLFIIAGLQEVPRELYEAAAIDGSGWWRTLVHITLPSIRRTLAFVVVADTVSSVLAFVPVQILTQGGPADSTRLVMYDLYNNTFQLGDANLGQTQVVVLLLFLVIITAVQFRMLNKEGD
ncbi:sugar ABC transporter permease [Actinomyces sp. B33]|uniref:carbohydrate ABC transporter permease n=1 Tax=Actinomyces sp. B33 TaxID=2942131 RepID=UPI0023419AE5|nr:sugar ABC transporter permease [Actinomyces sp. B33]MDC4232243.1 sugar ABC transporter permease [Actinomyces sp. B33]